jgi:hypothetical protein
MKATFTIDVEFDPNATDAESIASAADRLLKTALSTPGIMDEYANPQFGPFFVVALAKKRKARRRWVLYDLDADALLRTTAYHDYDEALDDAERANDVMVLPLVIEGIIL